MRNTLLVVDLDESPTRIRPPGQQVPSVEIGNNNTEFEEHGHLQRVSLNESLTRASTTPSVTLKRKTLTSDEAEVRTSDEAELRT
jgi:hypothetical protein